MAIKHGHAIYPAHIYLTGVCFEVVAQTGRADWSGQQEQQFGTPTRVLLEWPSLAGLPGAGTLCPTLSWFLEPSFSCSPLPFLSLSSFFPSQGWHGARASGLAMSPEGSRASDLQSSRRMKSAFALRAAPGSDKDTCFTLWTNF